MARLSMSTLVIVWSIIGASMTFPCCKFFFRRKAASPLCNNYECSVNCNKQFFRHGRTNGSCKLHGCSGLCCCMYIGPDLMPYVFRYNEPQKQQQGPGSRIFCDPRLCQKNCRMTMPFEYTDKLRTYTNPDGLCVRNMCQCWYLGTSGHNLDEAGGKDTTIVFQKPNLGMLEFFPSGHH